MSVSQNSKIFQTYIQPSVSMGSASWHSTNFRSKIFGENKMYLYFTYRAFFDHYFLNNTVQLLTWHLYQVGIISNIETSTQEDVCRVFANAMPFIRKGSLYLQMCLPWGSRDPEIHHP